jgi:hypothetical protein
VLGLGFDYLFLFLLVPGILSIIIGAWLYPGYKKAMKKWDDDKKQWRKTWYCARCDRVFIPEQQ